MHDIQVWENFSSLDSLSYLIIDQKVFDLHGRLFERFSRDRILLIKDPESWKNMDGFYEVIQFFSGHNLKTSSPIYAVGGGALLDLIGFCTAVFKRGIPIHFIPTTLLAMVDAAIGAKNALNFKETKNLLGTFHNPKAIIIYEPFLTTLDSKELLSGFSEMLKIGLIASKKLWKTLEIEALTTSNILECIAIKQSIVEGDLFDQNKRQQLNFGHTVGHAYESAMGFKVPHGLAVSLGMIVESYMSVRASRLSQIEFLDIQDKLSKIHGPFEKIPFQKLVPFLIMDKKITDQDLVVLHLVEIGKKPILQKTTLKEFEEGYDHLWTSSSILQKT